ncbi:MAG: MCE family protein [Phycisphaerales bacterium]|nr:MAG: MCE family protein [Phycisphaerales bacterium]
MKQITRDFLIGLTSIIALAGLILLLFWFGELDAFVRPRYLLTIHTENAMGLRPGSTVQLNGVPIGVVDAISIQSDVRYPVRIELLIDEGMSIPASAIPYVETSLIGALASLTLDAPPVATDTPVEFLSTDGQASISGLLQIRTVAEIRRELDQRMAPVVTALDAFKGLAETYIALGENLNELVTPPGEEVPGIERPANLRDTVDHVNLVLKQVEETVALAQDWLGDTDLRDETRGTLTNAREMFARADQTFARYEELADELKASADEMVGSLTELSDEIASSTEEVNRLVRLAREGEGTMGQLLNNPDLYTNLDDGAAQLGEAARKLQLLIERFRARGVKLDW